MGAASTTNAINVPLNDILYAGGWSTISTVLEAMYIDFGMSPSKATYIFFGQKGRPWTSTRPGGRDTYGTQIPPDNGRQ